MPYIPKSKIKIRTAKEGELVFAENLFPYQGQYIESSNGKFYAGTNNFQLGPRLIYTPPKKKLGGYDSEEVSKDVRIHNVLKPKSRMFVSNTTPIKGSKPLPTEKDYDKGYFVRYFTRRINSKEYKEINKDTFDSLKKRDGTYDHYLNEIGKINWHLTGDVYKKNTTSLQKITQLFTNVKNLFPTLNEFFRKEVIETSQENLYTSGGELYYGDGTEYIGPYHIHPEKGPMVGAMHMPVRHDRLFYSNQLPNKNIFDNIFTNPPTVDDDRNIITPIDYEEPAQAEEPPSQTIDTPAIPPSTPPPAPTAPPAPSYGGGGGY